MTAPAIALQETVSFGDLRKLAGATAPCITIAAILPNPIEIPTRLKNAVHGIEKDLSSSDEGKSVAGLKRLLRGSKQQIPRGPALRDCS